MEQLDTKFIQFLSMISRQKEIRSITELALNLGVSRRMVYYYVDKLNDFLKEKKRPTLQRQKRKGFEISKIQQQEIQLWMKAQETTDYVLTQNERHLLIGLLILIENKKWQLQHLQDFFHVSRNTVIKDVQLVKEWLLTFGVTIESNKKRGYFVTISELNRRQLIYQQLYLMEIAQMDAIYYLLVHELEIVKTPQELNQAIQAIEAAIYQTKTSLAKEITELDTHILAKMIVIVQNRSKNGWIVEWTKKEAALIEERLEFKIVVQLLQQLNGYFGIDHLEKEAYYYSVLLLCIEKNVDAHFLSNPFENLVYVTKNFVRLFEQIAGIHFHNRDRLIEKIQTHMKVLYYRHVFEVQMPNYLVKDLSNRYEKAVKLTGKVSIIMKSDIVFQTSFSKGLTKTEITEIAIYFEEAILKEQTRRDVLQVLVVSDCSTVLNNVIEAHLQQLLPESLVVGNLKSKSAYYYPGKVDYCISTNLNYVHPQGETVYVSPILTIEDKKRMKELGKKRPLTLKKREKIKLLLTEFQYIENQDAFILELEKLVKSPKRELPKKYQVKLVDFLKNSEFCFVEDQEDSLPTLLDKMSKPLIEEHYIQVSYREQIKEELNQGQLIFLYSKILLVHTDYRFGSIKPGCSFLFLKSPLIVKNNKEVQLIVFLATEETMAHVPLLFELDHLLQSNFYEILIKTASFQAATQQLQS